MKMNFTADAFKERGQFLGEGVHTVTITKVEDKLSKKGDPMVEVEFSDSEGRTARDWFMNNENMAWKMAQLALAAGFTRDAIMTVNWDTSMLKGKRLKLIKEITGKEVWEGKERNKYAQSYHQLDSNAGSAQAANDDTIPF